MIPGKGSGRSDTATHVRRDARAERRFLLNPEAARQAEDLLERHATRIRHVPGAPATRVGTIYFDTSDLSFASKAHRRPHRNLKVRVRLHERDRGDRRCRLWVEVKRRRDMVTRKLAIPVAPELVEPLLRGEAGARRSLLADSRPSVQAAVQELEQARAGRRLRPVVVARYHRSEFRPPEGGRITLDTDVAFYTPEAGCVFRGLAPPPREALITRIDGAILEVKGGLHAPEIPEWLRPVVDHLDTVLLGKFRAATAPLLEKE